MSRLINIKIAHTIIFTFLVAFAKAQAPDTSSIPESWRKESVIIIQSSVLNKIIAPTSIYGTTTKSNVHITYLARDKWGVTELSMISLPSGIKKSENKTIGRVYKKNGTTIQIPFEQLIPRKSTIKERYGSAFGSITNTTDVEEDQKLAVPALETGDILDLEFSYSSNNVPAIISISNSFPILKYNYELNFEQYCKSIDYNTTNTSVCSIEIKGKKIKITCEKVERYKEEVLSDKNLQSSYVELIYPSDNYTSEIIKIKDTIPGHGMETQVKLAKYIYDASYSGWAKSVSDKILAIIKSKTYSDTTELISDINSLYNEMAYKELAYSPKSEIEFEDQLLPTNDNFFSHVISRTLFELKIKHFVFVTQSNIFGPIKNANSSRSVFGISIPSRNLYLFSPRYQLEFNKIPPPFQGQPFYKFTANKYYMSPTLPGGAWLFLIPPLGVGLLPITTTIYFVKKSKYTKARIFDVKEGVLPKDSAESNQIGYDIELADIESGGPYVKINETIKYTGFFKTTELFDLGLKYNFYSEEENPFKKKLNIKYRRSNKNEPSKAKILLNYAKETLEDDGHSINKIEDSKLLESNFFNNKPLKLNFSFVENDILWNSGDYIFISAGKLIGKQLSIQNFSKKRNIGFYVPYRKQFLNTLTIHIPKNYSVENLSDFIFKRETPAGTFLSTANIVGNDVVIKTIKTYSFNNYPVDKSEDVYSFLREADSFYSKKLLFKKN